MVGFIGLIHQAEDVFAVKNLIAVNGN